MDWTVQGSNPSGYRFSTPIPTGPGAHPASCRIGTGSLSWGKKGADHPPPSRGEVKEKVQSYSPPIWSFMAGDRVNFTLLTSATGAQDNSIHACILP